MLTARLGVGAVLMTSVEMGSDDGFVGCEYGNRYSWCNSTMTREDCKQDSNVDDCCYSCFVLASEYPTTSQ